MADPTNTSPLPWESFQIGGLKLDTRLVVTVVSSTLLLMLDRYHSALRTPTAVGPLGPGEADSVIYFLLIPLFIITAVFHDRPAVYGFGLGDWRVGLKWSTLVILGAIPLLYFSTRTPAMTNYYSGIKLGVGSIFLTSGVDLVGWEFLFRGFLLFGLMRALGPSALVLQAVPFALMHLGKPEIETLSTIFGGTLFGWVAWRSRSFLYPFLIHWFVSSFVHLVALGWIG
ncbi:MAG TPA: CPBP family intramembrane glutamic endopeptidase [Anaerolineales bacterium]|nr:CPBP family intramembrane glutamic endopeptidase [Anaerolineales bacterium]